MEDDGEKSFCYLEGTLIDKRAAKEVSELHETVWYRMRPPKPKRITNVPFVSARQTDLIRSILLGKTALKPVEMKSNFAQMKPGASSTPRRDVFGKPSLKQRKSSVKFIDAMISE